MCVSVGVCICICVSERRAGQKTERERERKERAYAFGGLLLSDFVYVCSFLGLCSNSCLCVCLIVS